MKSKTRVGVTAFGLAFAMLAVTGCQTYFGGMTLPSGHYLKHPPQYFPPDPAFPLQRELDSMTDPDGASRRGTTAAPAVAAPAAAVNMPVPAAAPMGR
ncbi:hypothetical protein BH11PLA2_BH11PLA2_01200 [soil metagenome]